jgi:hypothetical protein
MSQEPQQASGTATPEASQSPPPQRRKFHNGWTRELESLFADWADKAACFRWMHERTERNFSKSDQSFMFPIIILSTVTGAANFALDSVVQGEEAKTYAQLGLGSLSILTGILTTIANRLGYASRSEAHRGAAISWGKFNRFICIELSLHPNERMDSMAFMKMFRTELDRLIEQSPSIPEGVISAFRHEFKAATNVKRPDIVGELEHTKVFIASNERLKYLAQEAALTIHHKKGLLKQMVMDDLDKKVRDIATMSARNFMTEQKAAVAAVAAAQKPQRPKTFVEQQRVEREAELKNVAQANVVASIKERFARGLGFSQPPPSSETPLPNLVPPFEPPPEPTPEPTPRGRTMIRRMPVVQPTPRGSIAGSVKSVASAKSAASGKSRIGEILPILPEAGPNNEFVISFDTPPRSVDDAQPSDATQPEQPSEDVEPEQDNEVHEAPPEGEENA